MAKLIKKANELLSVWRQCFPEKPQIDLTLLFNELILPQAHGDMCKIVHADFDSFEGIMAHRSEEGEWVIGINNRISHRPRRNFTLAHEIGHFIGHRKIRDRFECRLEQLNDYEIDKLEVEANEFAAQLLLPPDVVREHFKKRLFDEESVQELANKLGASKSAVAYRWVAISKGKYGFLISRDGMICNGRATDALYKQGTFFKGGVEIPDQSLIHRLATPGMTLSEPTGTGTWNQNLNCIETSYATRQEDYVYTYLDFEPTNWP